VLPRGYRGIIVCDTRRAAQWRKAFHAAGIDAVVVETEVDEAHGGAYKVGVPERKLIEANAIVTAVNQGKQSLPGVAIAWQAIVAVVLVIAMLAAFVAR
jgi:hypothetical protein